jgi:anti-sigma factor RsiW
MERLSPFLDDELDPLASREVARHLESCPECSAALGERSRLGESMRRDLEYHRAPDLLRERVMRDLRAAAGRGDASSQSAAGRAGTPSRSAAWSWRWMSVAAAFLVVIGGSWWITMQSSEHASGLMAGEVVSGHIRSLMANHLTDVTSTDQHTVKPWFAGKLDFSPPVTDFAAADFPLIGGRLDYLEGRPVAALVYMHRKHVINVFVWPEANGRVGAAPTATRQGYHVIHASSAGMTYWVVSDLNQEELAGFARMLAPPPGKS